LCLAVVFGPAMGHGLDAGRPEIGRIRGMLTADFDGQIASMLVHFGVASRPASTARTVP